MAVSNVTVERNFTTSKYEELSIEFDCIVETAEWTSSKDYPNGIPESNNSVEIQGVLVNGKHVNGLVHDFFISLVGLDKIESEALSRATQN